MAKTFTKFVCQQCGAESPQWFGRCPNCQKWNTLVEMKEKVPTSPRQRAGKEGERVAELVSLDKIKSRPSFFKPLLGLLVRPEVQFFTFLVKNHLSRLKFGPKD